METEIKLRVGSAEVARHLLESHGFLVLHERVFEANSIYDLPDGTLRARGHLLRLRQAGHVSTLTWKGAEIVGVHKSRPETEVGVTEFEKCDQLIRDLGYLLVFRYDKFRTEFRRPGDLGLVTLDETPVGVFFELEGAAEWIDLTAATLGFTRDQYLTESYGTLYRRNDKGGVPP